MARDCTTCTPLPTQTPDAQSLVLPQADRALIKSQIVELMIAVPEKLQVQLSDAVSTMAAEDFPELWPSLIQDLVGKLSATDYKVNAGVLQTAHSIFKRCVGREERSVGISAQLTISLATHQRCRYRHEFRTDMLFTEIKFVLEQFCAPFLQLFQVTYATGEVRASHIETQCTTFITAPLYKQNTDMLIEQYRADASALRVLFASLHLMCKIFLSLNSQDIPEFFEDHQAQFMPLFMKYLAYSNPILASDVGRSSVT